MLLPCRRSTLFASARATFAKCTEEKEKGNSIGNTLGSYLAAFEEVPKSVGCLRNNSSKARELLPKFHAYGTKHIELILCMVAESITECQATRQTIESLSVDLAPYLKDASKLPELVDFPGIEPLMQELKKLNGVGGKGLLGSSWR